MSQPATLRRSLGLPLVVLYGLGTTIGAGIYALTGEVAASAGYFAPLSFLAAAILAGFTAFSFAEMCSRFPRAAGEAIYVTKGLRLPRLGTAVGLLVALAASVSSAALINSFFGYLGEFVEAPRALTIVGLATIIGLVAIWGITESVAVASVFTLVEIAGLIIVIVATREPLTGLPLNTPDGWAGDAELWSGVFGATLLAFYAFLGFEDMVNVAEEVRDVEHIMPRAILITLIVTAVLYFVLTLSAVLTVAPAELGASAAPLALVYERATGQSSMPIAAIALFAVINGALIQTIMASRILYGLASQGKIPAWFGAVNRHTRTPAAATVVVAVTILLLALWLPLAKLAETTSTITLGVFTLVNLSLWRLKKREPAPPSAWQAPLWIPVVGFWVSLGFMAYGVARAAAGIH